MGSKQSSLTDVSAAETIPDTFAHYTNGAGHSKQLKKKKSLKKQTSLHFATSNSSSPIRDKFDHLRMGKSFDTSDSASDMPDAEELERRFHKGLL